MKANKTRKNKKQSGGFKFLTDLFDKGKQGWNKGKESLSQTSKNMFSPKPKPVATTTPISTTTAPLEPSPIVQGPMPVNNETGAPIMVPQYSDPMVPLTPITSGGRRRQRQRRKSQKKKLSKKKRYSRKKRGGYDLNDSAPVSGLKVASPTYWIGGKKSNRRRRKSRR